MNRFTYTTQKQLRAAFWRDMAECGARVSKRKIPNYSGKGTMHNTDTRCAWCDWLDGVSRAGDCSPELAERATL